MKASKSKGWPTTKKGKRAVWFGWAAIIWGILMPTQFILPLKLVSFGLLNGIVMVVLELVLAITALVYSVQAIFRDKERSAVLWITFGFLCLVGVFWFVFAIGEILVPH